MYHVLAFFVMVFAALSSPAADNNVPLTRNEVAALKKTLQAVSSAMGKPPAGYTQEEENFNLPTEAYKGGEAGRFSLINASLNYRFGTEKAARKSEDAMSKDYEKKIADAMAKGDYQEMGRLSQEMQQSAGKAQQERVEKKKDPINLHIRLNGGGSQAIDPDGVLMERPGVIALLVDKNDEKRNRVEVYFDPVALKETATLSRVDLRSPREGVAKKTAVLNITIELTGPAADVADWAKRVNTSAVLGQIDK
jgi:hypothetical protein